MARKTVVCAPLPASFLRGKAKKVSLFSWYHQAVVHCVVCRSKQRRQKQQTNETMKTNHSIRQAITTKWIAPTDTKPSRIKASCERGSITISWSYDGSIDENHRAAMAALLARFLTEDVKQYGNESTGWGHAAEWRGGAIGNGLIAWVHVPGVQAIADGLMEVLPYLAKMEADGAQTVKPVATMIKQIERALFIFGVELP